MTDFTSITSLIILALFPLCMIFATFTDLFTMTIPNKIVMALLLGFVVLAPLSGMSTETALWSVGVSVAVLVVGFTLFSFGAMGGGDAKLMAASALWFGTELTMSYLLLTCLLGGALTILILLARQIPLPVGMLNVTWINRLHDSREGIPYGAALGPAALYMFADSAWMRFASQGIPIG